MSKYQVSIERLNNAVGLEISTLLQYFYFHTHLEDKGYKYLAKLMKQISIAEMLMWRCSPRESSFWRGR